MLAKIRAEGLERSQVKPVFDTLTIDIGPRLTGSPGYLRAVEFLRERLISYGLSNVHLDEWTFGRGWTLERLTVEMIDPRARPLIGYADGGSPSTDGELVAAPVFIGGKTAAEVEAIRSQLKGAVVLTQPMMATFVRRDRPQPSDPNYVPNSAAYATSVGRAGQAAPAGRGQAGQAGQAGRAGRAGQAGPSEAQRITALLRDAGAGVLVRPSVGEHGTVFVTGRDGGDSARPAITLSGEHYNLIVRMLQQGVPVKLRVRVESSFHDTRGGSVPNLLAEIPGTDPAVTDEIVMVGAHLDSWHTGVGATDNADGSTTVVEAMRILKAAGVRPRRTIRVALWGGEEQGLLGSRSWVARHLAGDANQAAREKFNVYFNIDNGFGPIYGFYLQEREAVWRTFDAWLEPLKSLGARRNVFEAIGSTDHLSFIEAGVPGFNPIQSYENYDIRTHHTNMDTTERLNTDDIRQAAIVMATFAYQAAMADRKIPR